MRSDDEIIKALNLCASGNSTDIEKCVNCPLFDYYMTCTQKLINRASDLVKRLIGQNERLKTKNRKLINQNKET